MYALAQQRDQATKSITKKVITGIKLKSGVNAKLLEQSLEVRVRVRVYRDPEKL